MALIGSNAVNITNLVIRGLLSTSHVPGAILSTWEAAVSETKALPPGPLRSGTWKPPSIFTINKTHVQKRK